MRLNPTFYVSQLRPVLYRPLTLCLPPLPPAPRGPQSIWSDAFWTWYSSGVLENIWRALRATARRSAHGSWFPISWTPNLGLQAGFRSRSRNAYDRGYCKMPAWGWAYSTPVLNTGGRPKATFTFHFHFKVKLTGRRGACVVLHIVMGMRRLNLKRWN